MKHIVMPNDQDSLQAILARKPDYALLGARTASPEPAFDAAPNAEIPEPPAAASPAPKLPYTEHEISPDEFQTWLDQARLYALIDGLNLSDLPGQVSRRHPDAPVTLYHGPFGEHHEAETPRFVRLDADLLAWLQPVIDEDPGWGWCMVLCDDLAHLSADAALELLTEHFRPLVWVPQTTGGHWLFRLHDPAVLRNWLQCATPHQIERFMAPLRHLLIYTLDTIRVLTPRAMESPLHITPLPPAPWSEDTLQAMHRLGREALLIRFEDHLRTHHPAVRDWPDEQLRQFTLQQGNRAWQQGFQNEQAMIKYLSLCVVLGADFDTREDGEWARTILTGAEMQGTEDRITRLMRRAGEYLSASVQSSA